MPIPEGITREHVLRAIEEIDRKGIPPKNQARTAFLMLNDKRYPVKYVLVKAAQLAGFTVSSRDFNTIMAKSYLKKLGFDVINEKWYFGIDVLREASEKFIELAKGENLQVSNEQLWYLSKGSTIVYYQLGLPPELLVSPKWIHFEWLAQPDEDRAIFSVGLHLEFPREKKELNKKLAVMLLNKVNLEELSEKVGVPVAREEKRIYFWIMAHKEYKVLEDSRSEIVGWLARSMVEFYRAFLPALKEALPKVLRDEKLSNSELTRNPLSQATLLPKTLDKIESLLERKGQIILYGPPGTGKTWIAMEYVKSKVPGESYQFGRDRALRDDIKYYILVMSTAKYDPALIQEGLEETFSGRLQQAFEEVEEGDLAFVYLTQPYKRIIALAKCTGKTGEGAKFRILKRLDGPTYDEMKSEDPIRNSPAVRTMLRGTLFPISYEEALWMASKIGFDNLEPLGILSEGIPKKFKAFDFVTFHPAFSYEDFVEGIKPETYEDPETGKKELLFKVEEGIFKRIARNAYNALLAWAGIQKEWTENSGIPVLNEEERKLITTKLKTNPENVPKFYLIIDEINRGDIPKIFGELITLLETDKRLFMEHETTTTLPYSKKRFGVPPNLYIIGTMNTSDRSIALIDVALRRRFGFIEVMPDYEVINEHIVDKASEGVKPLAKDALKALETLNRRIRREYDRDHQIGHSYYLRLQGHLESKEEFLEELKMIWFHEILPLLQEYFYDSPEKLKRVLKSKDPAASFLEIDDSEDIVEFRNEDGFDNETFLQALKSLIEADDAESE